MRSQNLTSHAGQDVDPAMTWKEKIEVACFAVIFCLVLPGLAMATHDVPLPFRVHHHLVDVWHAFGLHMPF